jgi:hypothetical protein
MRSIVGLSRRSSIVHPIRAVALAVALLSLAACGGESEGEGGPTMQPGSNCMSCHTGGEPGRFTAAGTVYAGGGSSAAGLAGAVVTIVPKTGTTVSLTTNSVGNFYTSAPLSPPLTISVSFGGHTNTMLGSASSGACGACHKPAGTSAARVHVGNCTACHG